MPGLEENRDVWTDTWDWSQRGDEWSAWWGGTEAMWYGALLPRIHSFVPTGTILEIAPGYGRWTQFLKFHCQHLVVVDMAENCIEYCKQRFATSTNIEYHVNDGRSLEMVPRESVDFVFSFDSLVHAEGAVLRSYLEQLAEKLTPNGIGFFHHSNLGSYPRAQTLALKLPARAAHWLIDHGLLIDLHAWREENMTAEAFRAACDGAGLRCVGQENINWEKGPFLIDTLSLFTRHGSHWDRPFVGARNPDFRAEARRVARLYARSSFSS